MQYLIFSVCTQFQPTKENASGPKNNVITVKKQDFEVFEALDMDSISSASSTQYRKYHNLLVGIVPCEV